MNKLTNISFIYTFFFLYCISTYPTFPAPLPLHISIKHAPSSLHKLTNCS